VNSTFDLKHFIGGEFIRDGHNLERRNPSDISDLVARAPVASPALVEAAVLSARSAQPEWASLSPEIRGDVLDKTSQILMERREEWGQLLSREEGKTVAEGCAELERAARIFRFFGGEALRTIGDSLQSTRPGIDVETVREAVGVFGLITPWNFPIAIPTWKTAPALAFGNAVVIKPSELSPTLTHLMGTALKDAGLPNGVLNIIYGSGETGAALASNANIDGLSFTGSVATGGKVAEAAVANQTRIQCEMGGKNAIVILDDADIDLAVTTIINAAFFSTGQKCTAASRIIVTEGIYSAFLNAFSNAAATLKVGHALDPTTQVGPLASAEQLTKTQSYLKIAHDEDATVLGGELPNTKFQGHYISPAILIETSPEMRINQEEIFGPVCSVIRVKDYEEALSVVNNTKFGLSAGIMTNSLKHARHFRKAAKAGMVMVNLPTAGVDYHVPFGGTRASSLGPREQGQSAIEFYTQIKTCYTLPA
jgi:acyl-CoA reductase-like NAD-dependent aldehyde dehydrogenase